MPKWTSNVLRRLAVLLVSHPNVPHAILVGSTPSGMEMMPGFMARPSDGLSAAGERPEGIGGASKGYSSHMFSCASHQSTKKEETLKRVYLALSIPNRWGQQIFAAFADVTDKKERWKIFKPVHREYWRESEIQGALATITRDLQKSGHRVEVVPINEYHGILNKHKNQAQA